MQLSNNKKRKIKEMIDQAARACASGRFKLCDQLCARIESIQPGHPDAANIRAIMCRQTNQPAKAEQYFMNAIEAAPSRSQFHGNLGMLYLDQARYADALPRLREAVTLGPKSPPVQLAYSKALLETGHDEDAHGILEKLNKLQPHDPVVLMGLYLACSRLNRTDEARICLQDILNRQPEHAEARFELGVLENQMGNFEQGEAELRTALANKPGYADAYSALAEVKKFSSGDDTDIAAITAMHSQAPQNSPDRVKLGFSLGKIMDDLGCYDSAFEHFQQANAIRHKNSRYDNQREMKNLQSIMDAFTSETLTNTSGLDDSSPVFIVGMPRSGSTLVEQILAAHPDTGSKGEWACFERLLLQQNSEDSPLTAEKLAAFSPDQWHTFGQGYLSKLKAGHPDALRITDKSLRNIRMIGAIHCAMPNARIVHVRRHPLDTCLSIYKTDLRDPSFDYGCSLDALGDYYRMYLELMQHWRHILPAGSMYELEYERLITDQQNETRKLLDYCGLAWNDQCLQFDKANNPVQTASVAQVRRSMHTDSMAAWKRYKKHLKPLIRTLGKDYPKAV